MSLSAAKMGAKIAMGNSRIPYIFLNVIRGLNILSIMACVVASGCLLIKTSDLSKEIGWYNYFDLGEKALVILFAMCLLVTEMPRLMREYIRKNWPAFGYESNFVALSICFVFLGFDVLSYLAKERTNEEHLGGDFFRMVQAAGFMAIVMSPVNLVASFVLRDSRRCFTARQVRGFKPQYGEAV